MTRFHRRRLNAIHRRARLRGQREAHRRGIDPTLVVTTSAYPLSREWSAIVVTHRDGELDDEIALREFSLAGEWVFADGKLWARR